MPIILHEIFFLVIEKLVQTTILSDPQLNKLIKGLVNGYRHMAQQFKDTSITYYNTLFVIAGEKKSNMVFQRDHTLVLAQDTYEKAVRE